MAEQSISLGSVPWSSSSSWSGAVLVDAALVDGGGVAYLRVVRAARGGRTVLRLSATPTGSPSTAGPGFTAAVRLYAAALTFSVTGGGSITLKGPNHPDNPVRDASEPYYWTPDNAVAWQSWQQGLGAGIVTLTIRDGAAPAPNQDPTVAIDPLAHDVDGGAAVPLAATASDQDGSIASYAWAADVGMFDDAAAEDPTWTAPPAGAAAQAVTLTVTVTDDDGATAEVSVVVTVRPDEIPTGAWVRTVEGDVLDELCWRHYAREDAVPAVLNANPGLAALGPVLPPGRIVALPDLPPPARQVTAVRLWETPSDA